MANLVTNRGKYLCASGGITSGTDLRTLLVDTTGAAAATVDLNTVSQVTANEIAVSGYSRYDHASITITEDDANDFAYIDLDDAVFSSLASGETIGGAWLYKYNASDSSAELIAFYDVADTATNGGTVTIQWAAVGSGGALKLA